MRRQEKAITDRTEIDHILDAGQICRIAMAVDNEPYVVPMNYGYGNDTLYLHSALEGKKIDILRQNPTVWFEITGRTEIKGNDAACAWGAGYECVMGRGTAAIVTDPQRKQAALIEIMHHYSDRRDWKFENGSLDNTAVIEIRISEIAGKRSGDFSV